MRTEEKFLVRPKNRNRQAISHRSSGRLAKKALGGIPRCCKKLRRKAVSPATLLRRCVRRGLRSHSPGEPAAIEPEKAEMVKTLLQLSRSTATIFSKSPPFVVFNPLHEASNQQVQCACGRGRGPSAVGVISKQLLAQALVYIASGALGKDAIPINLLFLHHD